MWICVLYLVCWLHIFPWCVCFLCTIKSKPHGFFVWNSDLFMYIPHSKCRIFALMAERHLVLLHVTDFTFIFGPMEIIWLIFVCTHTHTRYTYILNRILGNHMIIPLHWRKSNENEKKMKRTFYLKWIEMIPREYEKILALYRSKW